MAVETFSYELIGVNEVLDALDALPERTINNLITSVGRQALRKNVVLPLRSGLPYSTKLTKNIKITYDKRDRSLWAGPTSDSFILRFLEKGTKGRYQTHIKGNALNKPRYIGAITGKPIGTRIVDASPTNIINFFNKEFGEEVNKALEKRIKKIKKV